MITSHGTPLSFASDEIGGGERLCRLEFNRVSRNWIGRLDPPLRYLPGVAWSVAVRAWWVPSLYRDRYRVMQTVVMDQPPMRFDADILSLVHDANTARWLNPQVGSAARLRWIPIDVIKDVHAVHIRIKCIDGTDDSRIPRDGDLCMYLLLDFVADEERCTRH